MSKLMFASIDRIKKDMTFWVCVIFMFVVGLFVSLKADVTLDRVFFIYAVIIGLVSSVFCGMFIGTEHGEGTLRNKLIVGHTKASVYLSNLIVCLVAGVALCISYIIPMLAIGIPRLGVFEMSTISVFALIGTSLALTAAFTGIFTLISMLCQNKAVTAVICILCFIALFVVGAFLNSKLQEPEFVNNYVTSVNGVSNMQLVPNPKYVTGVIRDIYQIVYDVTPGGQALQFAEMNMIHTWQLPMYSLLIFAITSVVGVCVFKKANIS